MWNKFDKICIFTTTKYDNDDIWNVRYPLFFKLLKNCEDLWIDIIDVDDSSNSDFLGNLPNYKSFNFYNDCWYKSLWEKRRASLKYAMELNGKEYFLWTEPEKFWLIKESIINNFLNLSDNWVDLVIPNRTLLFNGTGCMAAQTELIANDFCNEQLKSEVFYDFWFWPKFFSRKFCNIFLEYNKNGDRMDAQDSVVIPFINAIYNWVAAKSFDMDYKYTEWEILLEYTRPLIEKRLFLFDKILMEVLKSF